MTVQQFFRRARLVGVFVSALSSVVSVHASAIVLNFAGLKGNSQEAVMNYYNGGAGSLGSTGGPSLNFGVSFGSDALSLSGQPGGVGNTALIPGGPGSNALYFLTGAGDVMNVAAGFDTGFSFYYSSPNLQGTVQLWTGVDGTGTQIGSDIPLLQTKDGSNTLGCLGQAFCPYEAVGLSFTGTARSVIFTGTANDITFAEITIGSATPGGTTVPAPATLVLVGLGLLSAYVVGRRTGF